jgi:pimeloyl-ACP methyl ester carboxylesterase/DNA-binding CsgD family transcriptional regulator
MAKFRQEIRFAPSAAGPRIAYALSGEGYPLVRAPHWLTHVEWDWQTAVWAPWLDALSRHHRLLRFDATGTGLSDPAPGPPSLDDLVADLEAVVDAAGVERFALLGMSQGAAVSIRYAARHPQRVSHLVLFGAFVRGTLVRTPGPESQRLVDAMCQLVESGWGQENAAYRQLFTSQFFPAATVEQMRAFNDLELLSATPLRAAQLVRAFAGIDAVADLANVRCPALVLHKRADARIPFEEGRLVAAGIAGARFEPLEGPNHLPLPGDPAFDHALTLMREFLPQQRPLAPQLTGLSDGERELLELLARGLDNAQIAAQLGRAEKTVRNRVSALMESLGSETRAQAIVRGREAGFGMPKR